VRVAALYDIHANLPALEAVLAEVRGSGVDHVVIGGDAIPGPMPRETLELLRNLDLPVSCIHGNCERAALAQMEATRTGVVRYWGTVSGRPLPPEDLEVMRWTARLLQPEFEAMLASWPMTLRLEVDGLGPVVFCHGTPRSETEVFTRRTPEARLRPLFDPLGAAVVVCGHSHMPFDRMVGTTRVVNAGSVGMPFGSTGAFWLTLGPEVRQRRTEYDLARAVERIRATAYPLAERDARSLIEPRSEDEMITLFESFALNLDSPP
jgi:predicted phosphodiesterase